MRNIGVISTKTEGRVEKSLTLPFLLILALSTVARVFLSVFPKTAVTYNDELFYLELSQNFFLRGTLTVYNTPLSFSKLLYPILISPFYAVTDGVLRTHLISAFNALLMSSSLIPGYLLARRVLKKNWQVILSVLILALSPNLLFSISFMAENLYYPLLLWGFYAAYSFFASESRKPLRAFGLGILAFLLYFTKEVGAGWAFAAFVALAAAGQWGNKKSRKEVLLPLGCYLLGIILPYIIIHLTLLRGMGYSYTAQASFANLSDSSHIVYFLYAAGIMFLWFLLSVLFFPAAVPFFYRKKLSPVNRVLFRLSGLYLVSLVFGVAFGVSLYSDYADPDLRVHLRYFLGAAFPLLLLCLSVLDEAEPVTWKSPLVVSSAVFATLVLLFLHVPRFGSVVDFPLLHFTHLLPRDSLRWRFFFTGVAVLLLVPPLLLWNKKRNRAFACFLLPLLLVFECFSGVVFSAGIRDEETVRDPVLLEEARQLDRLLDTAEGNTLFLADPSSPALKPFNTVLNDDYAFVSADDIRNLAPSQEDPSCHWLDLASRPLPDSLSLFSGRETCDLSSVDRVVLLGAQDVLDACAYEDITPEGISFFRLYRAKDPSRLTLRDPLLCPPDEPVLFYGDKPSFRNYRPEGFSDSENGYTWSAAQEVSLTLKPDVAEFRDLGCVWTWRMTIWDQPCQVFANDVPVFDGIISGENGEVYFIIPEGAWSGSENLTLRFLFPEAREPGNGDPRILAVAFESLTLE